MEAMMISSSWDWFLRKQILDSARFMSEAHQLYGENGFQENQGREIPK